MADIVKGPLAETSFDREKALRADLARVTAERDAAILARHEIEEELGWWKTSAKFMRDMLREAADVFRQYAEHHREKGATEKAERNQELADRFQRFLTGARRYDNG